MRRTPVGATLGVGVVLLAAAGPLSAQHVVEGRVLGSADGMPIEDVTVTAVGEDVVVGTDSTGYFRFQLPENRPGVTLAVEVIGYRPFERTWILPLAEPVRIGLQQQAVELQGIDVEVERSGWATWPLEEQLKYRVRSMMGIDRVATAADLRAFPDQRADVWQFLPWMTVATGAGCEECLMASGRIEAPGFILDDRGVSYDEFRSYMVEDICRVEVVTIPIPFKPVEKGVVLGYTCSFLREVATGKRRLSPFPGMDAR